MPFRINSFFLAFCLILLPFLVYPQAIQNIGVPYIQNYSKAIYQSGNQNWSIVKGRNGMMYFANSEGLLSFDGNNWRLNQMPNNVIVRAVATDSTGNVYVGGFGEFGYWNYNKEGKFTYHSLLKLVPQGQAPAEEIWKIYVDGNRVLFQSFARIYIYQNGKMEVVRGENSFLFLHKVGNRFFAEVLSRGLYELKENTLEYLPDSHLLGNTGILSILPHKQNSYMIGTAKDGLFLYDGSGFRPWKNQGNTFLKNNQLNNGARLLGKFYAYGTILNGIIILDEEGNIVQQLNKSNSLQNNTVLSLYEDEQHNLWAGLDNGIDRVEISSPLYFYFDKAGRFGTVYSSIIHQGKIYLGTNQGLFYSEWSSGAGQLFQSFDFKLIENSQGQVWDLSLQDGQLLCGHNNGTYRVEGTSLQKVSERSGGWTIKKLPSDPDYLVQGTYNGLALYTRDRQGNWKFSHTPANYSEPSRYVEQDNSNNIWVSHVYRGLHKLSLSEDLREVTQVKKYGKEQGLPDNQNINVLRIQNRIVFSTDKGFYIYDEISDRFLPYEQLNRKLGSFASSNMVIRAGEQGYWFINRGKLALVSMLEPGKLHINSSQFNALAGRMVKHYENISRISSSLNLISIDDGFVIYNTQAAKAKANAILPAVLINSIENITDKRTLLSENGSSSSNRIELPYSQNNLRISYSFPYYNQANVRFQYLLEGYSRDWSEWSSETQKEFTNLKKGNYRFLVRAKVNEANMSEASVFEFTVLSPWYTSTWAKLVYLLLAIAAIFGLKYLYDLKLRRDQRRILHKLEQEKEDYLRQQRFETEQKLIKLKNEQLQADLATKSRDLANSALNIVHKNELLQTIKDEVIQLNEMVDRSIPKDQFRKINKIIEEGIRDNQGWHLFESSFNEANENYYKKLKADNPGLTPNDLKLCAFLRMNMSSKEMAALLNITVRSVELRRYRLRKRLNLEHETNLTEYLLSL
jgi:ligand-binding sensor domain-containing protein/DNA-binding CsgD family transcriptional regulator